MCYYSPLSRFAQEMCGGWVKESGWGEKRAGTGEKAGGDCKEWGLSKRRERAGRAKRAGSAEKTRKGRDRRKGGRGAAPSCLHLRYCPDFYDRMRRLWLPALRNVPCPVKRSPGYRIAHLAAKLPDVRCPSNGRSSGHGARSPGYPQTAQITPVISLLKSSAIRSAVSCTS